LTAQGVTVEAVRQAAAAALPPAAAEVPALIPFDGQAKKALELTFREALRLGHDYVGTEHLLLALLEVEGDTGVLCGLGVEKAAVEAAVTRYLSSWQSGSPLRAEVLDEQ
jgi:ATP-dependent Clp protease ATP-binding subunit ClpA